MTSIVKTPYTIRCQ